MKPDNERSKLSDNDQEKKQQYPKTREKVKNTINTAKKNASCSHGWLRLLVQCIFGAITIASFILIVYMSIANRPKQSQSRCRSHRCNVVCVNVPFIDSFVNDLANAVKEIEINCAQIGVTLHDPYFVNASIPSYWLSRLNSNVNELEIIGGNLQYIAPNAFMTEFGANIRKLRFNSVTITDWVPESFTGLINLGTLSITNTFLIRVNRDALAAIDDTLETLSITESGYWNPANLTGRKAMALTTVTFSNNNFNNILHRKSFTGLQQCKVLYLNSCRISSIGQGAFDNLVEIETLFLNNNLLVILPDDLFTNILLIKSHQPRINLQNNLWFCDCSSALIPTLITSGVLDIEPTCYYPFEVRGQTFLEFTRMCQNYTTKRDVTDLGCTHIDAFLLDDECNTNQGTSILISSTSVLSCTFTQQKVLRQSLLSEILNNKTNDKRSSNNLLKVRFAMQSHTVSMLEITSPSSSYREKYGLLWYQTSCPLELYCVNTLPNYLRVFNVKTDSEYTFCPINLESGKVDPDTCVFDSLHSETEARLTKVLRILSYIFTTVICTVIGASIVYTIIRKFPYLLRGSDRILFVKHKNVDALVLPPKVPLRENVVQDYAINDTIFTLTDSKISRNHFVRKKSTRSNKSIAPSYISAMQPTDEQLIEWRLRKHFDNNATITSSGFNVTYLPLTDDESMYCSLDQMSSNNYESLKATST